MSNISLSDILSDPINYGIALAIVAAIYLLQRYVWPAIKSGPMVRYENILTFAIQAAQAAEQARRTGDLNAFADMFGVEVDLSDNAAVRQAVTDWVQQKLTENFRWGSKVNVGDILIVLHSIMRQDIHKGKLNAYEQMSEGQDLNSLLQYVDPQLLEQAAEITKAGKTPQIPVAQAMPVSDSRRRRTYR